MTSLRNHTAKCYKEVRKVLKYGLSEPQIVDDLSISEYSYFPSAISLIGSMLICGLILISSCKPAHAEEYSDNQIANAIRKAEGNWTYGIKSVKCSTEQECRKICLITINHNRIRFNRSNKARNLGFICFLANRYAPIGAGNDPKGLNRNWLKNVNYFLHKEIV